MSSFQRQFGRLIASGASRPSAWRYGIAVALPLVALAVTVSVFSLHRAPFFPLFSVAVVLAAIFGGRKAGLVATTTSLLVNVSALPPRWSLGIADAESLVRVALFAIAAVGLSLLIGMIGDLQRKLDIERERLFTTLASIGDCVVTTDAKGDVTFLNAVAEEATGWPTAEAAGKPLEEVFRIVNEKTRQTVPDPVRKVIQTGRIVGLANHTVLVRRDGTEIPIDDSAAPIRDLQGNIVGVVLVFRDVTRERQSEAALIRSEKLASVGRLAASIAHEVNNPLAAISNLLYLIENAPDVGAASRALAQTAQHELSRAAYVTKHALSFARRSEIHAPVELGGLIDEIVGLYANRIQSKSVRLLKKYQGSGVAEASSSEAKQVIANLIGNALDALEEGGKLHLRLAPSTWLGTQRVRLTVGDTGSGISEEHMRRIFEPFFSTKLETGTGLGLWVSKRIVDSHGGCVHVRSRVSKGTVVIVCWPAATEPVQSGEAAAS
ncbi:MAG: ATP-binding protein [Terriglobales bacterium]